MSLSMSDDERITLDRLVPLLRAEGYEVIPDPGPEDLPSFLGEWHPDAIAIGKRPSLIVEVFRKEGGREPKKSMNITRFWRIKMIGICGYSISPHLSQSCTRLLTLQLQKQFVRHETSPQ